MQHGSDQRPAQEHIAEAGGELQQRQPCQPSCMRAQWREGAQLPDQQADRDENNVGHEAVHVVDGRQRREVDGRTVGALPQ
jgi:hypothetical protein